MGHITLATSQTQAALEHEGYNLDYGVYNRRRIAGSLTWSQHSWGNANDITQEGRGYGDTSPSHMAYLDRVHSFLEAYAWELSIRTLLWRKSMHWDHIHVDYWAMGYGRPPRSNPTTRGRFQYSWDEVVKGDPGPENGLWTPDEGIMLMNLTEYIATLIPEDVTKLVNRYLPGHDDQYWIDKLDNPSDPEWARFYVSIDVESKAQLPT